MIETIESSSLSPSILSTPTFNDQDAERFEKYDKNASKQISPLAEFILKLREDIIQSGVVECDSSPNDKTKSNQIDILRRSVQFYVNLQSAARSQKSLNTSVKSNSSFVKKMKSFPEGLSAQQKQELVKELQGLSCSRYLDEILDSVLKISTKNSNERSDSTANAIDMTSMSSNFNASSVTSMMNSGPIINGSGGIGSSSGYVSASTFNAINNQNGVVPNYISNSSIENSTPTSTRISGNNLQESQVKELSFDDFSVLLSLFTILFLRYDDDFSNKLLEKLINPKCQLHNKDKIKFLLSIYLLGMNTQSIYNVLKALEKISQKTTKKLSDIGNNLKLFFMIVEDFRPFFFEQNSVSNISQNEENLQENQYLNPNLTQNQNSNEVISNNQFLDDIQILVPKDIKNSIFSIFSKFISTQEKQFLQRLTNINEKTDEFFSSEKDFNDEERYELLLKLKRTWMKYYEIINLISDLSGVNLSIEIIERSKEVKSKLEESDFLKQLELLENSKRGDFDDEDTRSFYRDVPSIPSINQESEIPKSLLELLGTNLSLDNFENWIKEFAPYNNKINRYQIIKEILSITKISFEKLPILSRIVKSLDIQSPDIGNKLKKILIKEFEKNFSSNDSNSIDSRIRNIRLIGELTKFQIIPPFTTLDILRRCLTNVTPININIACVLLDSCGRYLLLNQQSRKAMRHYLDLFDRLKTVRHFDEALNIMIENSIYSVNIEAAIQNRSHIESKPPLYRFIKHVIENHKSYSPSNKLKIILSLDWKDPDTIFMLVDILQDLRTTSFDKVHIIAALISDLSLFYPKFSMSVIDRLIEDIRASISNEIVLTFQRRISDIKLLGELFVRNCIDFKLILNLLYIIVRYNQNSEKTSFTFRIILVCMLIETSFIRFSSHNLEQLEQFIKYFQCYILNQNTKLPIDIEVTLKDTINMVSKNLKWPDANEFNNIIVPSTFPSQDTLFPIITNKENKSDVHIDISNKKEFQSNKKENQEKKLEDIKLERELQQMIQQDATQRKIKRISKTPENVLEKLRTALEKSSTITTGNGKKILILKKQT